MKVCPTCKRSYADDLLNFCLDDGSVLTAAGGSTADIYVNQARPTVATPPTPRTMEANYAQPPPAKGSSKRGGIWAVVILGLLAVLCGGAAIVGLVLVSVDTKNDNDKVVNNRYGNDGGNYNYNYGNSSTGTTYTVNLSEWAGARPEGTLEQQGSESVMWSKLKGYYFVLVAPQTFSTVNANTTLTVRNVDDANTSTGFGLVFHSDPKPLQNDYAFLIDSKRKRYRIVKHNALKETDLVKWTVSNAIKNGTQKNVLEVRDLAGTMEFFVNGRKLTAVPNERDSIDGVPGLYSGDGIKAAFSELKVGY
jgi:hypothetical protein